MEPIMSGAFTEPRASVCPDTLIEENRRLRLQADRTRDLELKVAAQAVEIAGLRLEIERLGSGDRSTSS